MPHVPMAAAASAPAHPKTAGAPSRAAAPAPEPAEVKSRAFAALRAELEFEIALVTEDDRNRKEAEASRDLTRMHEAQQNSRGDAKRVEQLFTEAASRVPSPEAAQKLKDDFGPRIDAMRARSAAGRAGTVSREDADEALERVRTLQSRGDVQAAARRIDQFFWTSADRAVPPDVAPTVDKLRAIATELNHEISDETLLPDPTVEESDLLEKMTARLEELRDEVRQNEREHSPAAAFATAPKFEKLTNDMHQSLRVLPSVKARRRMRADIVDAVLELRSSPGAWRQ
jgi:hypothetical protein